jgi:hypothetical protein
MQAGLLHSRGQGRDLEFYAEDVLVLVEERVAAGELPFGYAFWGREAAQGRLRIPGSPSAPPASQLTRRQGRSKSR